MSKKDFFWSRGIFGNDLLRLVGQAMMKAGAYDDPDSIEVEMSRIIHQSGLAEDIGRLIMGKLFEQNFVFEAEAVFANRSVEDILEENNIKDLGDQMSGETDRDNFYAQIPAFGANHRGQKLTYRGIKANRIITIDEVKSRYFEKKAGISDSLRMAMPMQLLENFAHYPGHAADVRIVALGLELTARGGFYAAPYLIRKSSGFSEFGFVKTHEELEKGTIILTY